MGAIVSVLAIIAFVAVVASCMIIFGVINAIYEEAYPESQEDNEQNKHLQEHDKDGLHTGH